VRGRHGDTFHWMSEGIEIQEIEFVIADKKSGNSRVLGQFSPLLVSLCFPDSDPSRPLGKWQS